MALGTGVNASGFAPGTAEVVGGGGDGTCPVLDAGGLDGSVCATPVSGDSSSNVSASGKTTKSPFAVACGIGFAAGGFRQGKSGRGPSAARTVGVKPATIAKAAPKPNATRHRPEHIFMAASLMQSSGRRLAGASARI